MEFKTKFNVDEHAWYMKDNKPVEVIISCIDIFHVNTDQDHIKYRARNLTNSTSWLDHQNLLERMLFKTKGELLKSLFGNDKTCKGENYSAINGEGHSPECIKEHNACCSGENQDMAGFDGTLGKLSNLRV